MKKKRIKPALLHSATPYPWKRDHKGDLCGANGLPVYFHGADAVLVEHSPLMAEALFIVHALTGGRRVSQRTLKNIRVVTARILARLEKSNRKPGWCTGSVS